MYKLNKEQLSYFNCFIKGLKDKERLNLCESCNKKFQCGNKHSLYFICSLCAKTTDVINCAIANEVIKNGIEPQID
ncbi:hypothetical protein [Clostridium akagii]|uniref:hypothetical protein n=1 Tax=Clostridium akagii TaxID=91623 RepID=UPI000479259E|nr:hypothetical protein [Clostridium akagii]